MPPCHAIAQSTPLQPVNTVRTATPTIATGSTAAATCPDTTHPKDGRAVFARGLDLPRTDARERVTVKDRDYDLEVSEVRSLATIGAFRVVDSRDLDATPGARQGDLERLRDLKLVEVLAPAVSRR